MKRAKMEATRPRGLREFEFVHAGPDGAYWHAADGMRIRVAAAEHAHTATRETRSTESSFVPDEMSSRHAGAW
jgi:hypothetical protein